MIINPNATPEEQLDEFIARGGSPHDPFLPTSLRHVWEARVQNGSPPKSRAEQIAWGQPHFRLVELVNSGHTDGELQLLAAAAEIGAGHELPGLTEMLIRYRGQLRDAIAKAGSRGASDPA